ncbi:MAG: hypothetical protein RBS73_01775 [Prolixibacteraceae bacterium]|jgi:hypothetical protein|nr:hypothetical protein [Prolixibacteraceae bacterium]
MNNIIVTTKRSVFPLTKFYFSIGKNNYSIRPGELKKIELYEEGAYEVIVSTYWINKKVRLILKNQSILSIAHIIPDAYYLIGTAIVVCLSILGLLGIISAVLLSGTILLYFLPLIYYTFFKPNDYFKIEVKGID